MQFKVPQFLDIEDKIFGPFTFKQFAYLAGGGGIIFILFKLLGFFWGTIPILMVGGLTWALIYYRPNNKPFIYMMEAFLKYMFQEKLYIWSKREVLRSSRADSPQMSREETEVAVVRLNSNKLKDLAWSLDVLDMSKNKESDKNKVQ